MLRRQGAEYRSVGDFIVLDTGSESRSCSTYVAKTHKPDLLPYYWYRDLIVAGAGENGLGSEYINQLRLQQCVVDPKPDRRARVDALHLLNRLT
jgi:hypothetical protein